MARKQVTPTYAPTPAERKQSIDRIITDATKLYGPGRVERSESTQASYLLRRPTGITSLDIAMAGGWPAAAPSVLVGPEGVGKDYLLWRSMAETQRIYGDDFCAACYFTEFKPDKAYMKDVCGLQVAFSEGEIEELDRARRDAKQAPLTATELDHYRRQVGEFVAIYGIAADHGFDQIFELIKANVCQIVAVNSIGFMQTQAKEQVDSYEEFPQQRNEAMLLSKALPQFAMYLNQGDEHGRPNETSLILVNQVRSRDQAARSFKGRPPMEKDQYRPASNSFALKHGKALEVSLHNGKVLYDESLKPPMKLGRERTWEITKGKLGTHEGLRGAFNYIDNEGADVYSDVVDAAVKLGLIEVSGSWVTYECGEFRFKTQGASRARELVEASEELYAHLRERCFQQAGTVMRHK